MIRSLSRSLRGVWLLRHPEIRRFLGDARQQALLVAEIRNRHPGSKVAFDVELVGYARDRLVLADGVSICKGSVLAFGDDRNGFGSICVGSGTWIGQYNNLRACADGNIEIGSQCLVSQFCSLIASNHAVAANRPIISQGPDASRLGVTLEDDVWLGSGVAVMPGVRLGRGSVIGANSVVTRSVPQYEIWAGCPARKIGQRA